MVAGILRVGAARGLPADVRAGAGAVELIGQAYRSAVILVHAEGLRQAPGR